MSVEKFLATCFLPKWGPVTLRKVLQHFGDFDAAFKLSPRDLMQVSNVGKELSGTFKWSVDLEKRVQEELSFCAKHNIQIVTILDQDYPFLLKQNPDAPLVLFVKGTMALNSSCNLAVIGTRKPSKQSVHWLNECFKGFGNLPLHIVSGLAHGTDALAHKHALDLGLPTTAVLAHGFDTLYPAANKTLARTIVETKDSCLVTEFPSGVIADKVNFPRRNRIVAGICKGTLVVESQVTGGSMITAKYAFDYSREVMAVPQTANHSMQNGCNALIKRDVAALVENSEDVLKIIGVSKDKPTQTALPLIDLTLDEDLVFNQICKRASLAIDDLAEAIDKSTAELALILLQLELKGLIIKQAGGGYKAL